MWSLAENLFHQVFGNSQQNILKPKLLTQVSLDKSDETVSFRIDGHLNISSAC